MKSRRLEEMEIYILENNQVKIDELMARFNVSLNTVRRDINELAERGVVKKVYGGVQATEIKSLIPFENRHITEADEKKLLSKTAASFIEDGETVFIDSGTTTQYMLNYLDPTVRFTLLTNNLDVIIPAAENPAIKLIVVGSNFKHDTRSFVSVPAQMIEAYNIDKAFMATSGFTLNGGFTNSEHLEYLVKKSIVEKANTVYILADHTKFGKAALLTYATPDSVSSVITTTQIDNTFKEGISNTGCQLIYANQ